MSDPKLTVMVSLFYENSDTSKRATLQQFTDGSTYISGDVEAIFETGGNPLKSASAYLERKGYRQIQSAPDE